ncbi:hypothetical protein SUGI_0955160 [Cryptomeria japonica]|nr:hypothetical protein SUGI_0955160 [Cryptomeria japonica]
MSGDPGISAFPEADNMLSWVGTINSGKNTVYEGLSLLGEPNNDSPLDSEVALLWSNQEEFKKNVLKHYEDAGGVRSRA